MKNLKFKAFHYEDKKIYDVTLWRPEGCFLVGAKPEKDQLITNLGLRVHSPNDGSFCFNNEFAMMESTNKRDVKNRTIFSGHKLDYNGDTYTVSYSDYFCRFVAKSDKYFLIPELWSQATIVGHIYSESNRLTNY